MMHDYVFVYRPNEIGDYQNCVGLAYEHEQARARSRWKKRAKYLVYLLKFMY